MAMVRSEGAPARATAPVVMGVRGWECLDSRGTPTVGCVVYLEGGFEGNALAPAGASTGRFERPALYDGGSRYAGHGVRAALRALDETISPRLIGVPGDQVDGLLDEPVAGMNDVETDRMAELIRQVRDRLGVTILLVEHHMGLVMRLADRITVLSLGRRVADGTAAEVRADPAVVEAYLGTSATEHTSNEGGTDDTAP